MTKKTALTAAPQRLRKRVLLSKINNGFNAVVVKESLFGKDRLTKNIVNNDGFNYGCKKVTRLDNWFGFLDTAQRSSSELKTIGLNNHPKKPLIMEHAST